MKGPAGYLIRMVVLALVAAPVVSAATSLNGVPPADALDSSAACVTPPSGMIAWWRAESNADDSAGAHDGVLLGDTSFAPGEVGRSFLLDGSGDWVSVPDDPAWATGLADFSVDAWINVATGAGGDLTIIGQGSDSSNWWRFGITSQARLRFQVAVGGPPAISVASVPFALTLNSWHHVAVTRSSTTNWAFYFDGVLLPPDSPQNVGVVVLDGAVPDLPAPLTIGQPGFNQLFFKGGLDEIEVFNRAVQGSEVAALFEAGTAGKCVFDGGDQNRRPFVELPRVNLGGAVGAIVEAAAQQARENRASAALAPASPTGASVLPPNTGGGGLKGAAP